MRIEEGSNLIFRTHPSWGKHTISALALVAVCTLFSPYQQQMEKDTRSEQMAAGDLHGIGSMVNFTLARIMDYVVSPVYADQVIADDLIVQGSGCIGDDCVNEEAFGFDTLKLKENNLRILFMDTSSVGNFPTNDWEIVANDSAQGGASYFGVRDVDGSALLFTLEAGAPAHSLFVNTSGNVGLGTETPTEKLHVMGNAIISGSLELGSSREIKNNIEPLPSEEALQAFDQLRPVKFQYRSNPHEKSVGFIAEDVPELVATNGRRSISTMDVVAVMTKVVQEQQRSIAELKAVVEELRTELARSNHSSAIAAAE